jgi:membrane fusion protein, multidrug efflux system
MRNIVSSVAMLLAVALTVGGCSGRNEADNREKVPAPVVKGAVLETVKSVAMPEVQEVVGTVRARTSAIVAARVPGTISVLKVREGDRVRKGQVLAQLNAQENQASAAGAAAGVEDARRALDEAVSRKKLAVTTFERFSKLYTGQAVTRQEFDVKQTEKELAVQAVSRAEARLKQAREGARAADTMAGYTLLTAPISGIITSKQVDLGASVFPAQPLITIEDDGSYQLELAVPENLVTRIKQGSPVQVTLDSLGETFSAGINDIVPAADPVSRTFIAKVSLNRKGLKSGMFGRAAISMGSMVNSLSVAANAVVEHGSITTVWVVGPDNIARLRIVKTGKSTGGRVEILSGLSEGERVVDGSPEKISEGARVE